MAKSIEAHLEALVKDSNELFNVDLIEKEKRSYSDLIEKENEKKQQMLEMFNLPKWVWVPVKDQD